MLKLHRSKEYATQDGDRFVQFITVGQPPDAGDGAVVEFQGLLMMLVGDLVRIVLFERRHQILIRHMFEQATDRYHGIPDKVAGLGESRDQIDPEAGIEGACKYGRSSIDEVVDGTPLIVRVSGSEKGDFWYQCRRTV